MRKLMIGFIGNFNVPFTTENERKWSFEQLGHTVIPFQENETNAAQLLEAMPKLDMLVYSHTHDPAYVIDGLIDVFAAYREAGIPTVSAHLDRWLWLKRVEDVGKEATWFTEHIFMADASPEAAELYDSLGLNWHYLKPAVVAKDCYMAEPDYNKYPHEIIFTGSKGYHPEYPFRPQLIDWLQSTYGKRFGQYGNDGIGVVRMDELNTLYATAKIVIGDSCFGGRPNYTSDRLTESVGRGAFLITPDIETLGIPVETYKHPDLEDLKRKIDYWLLTEHEKEREALRKQGFEWVKNNETYTHRAKEIIKKVGLA